ncbi:hypothetical protein Tco_0743113 [Tanacetum coccineum]
MSTNNVQYEVLDTSQYDVFSVVPNHKVLEIVWIVIALGHQTDMAPLPHRDLRHPWLRYQVDGYDEGQTLGDRLSYGCIAGDDGDGLFNSLCGGGCLSGARRRMAWRQFILALGLHSEEEMAKPGFGAYWAFFPYVHIRDPMRRLCHRMIACSISGRGQGAEKVTRVDLSYLWTMDHKTANVPYLLVQYLFHHAEGRKSGARLSGGHFIGRLVAHFGLVGDQGLRAPRPERQQDVAAGAPRAAEGALAVDEGAPAADEGAQVVPAPVQAPQPPPPAPQPRTMSQRIDRLEEEVREMRQSVVGLRRVVESSIIDQTRVSTWMISCMMQLMDASGRTYQAIYLGQPFCQTSLRLSSERRVRPRIGDASTSIAP